MPIKKLPPDQMVIFEKKKKEVVDEIKKDERQALKELGKCLTGK